MSFKKIITISAFVSLSASGYTQTNPADTIPSTQDESLDIDAMLEYDDLLSDLGNFLDSILAPRSYFLISSSAASNYFNFRRINATDVRVKKKLVLSPVIGYYHKSGPGFTLAGNIVNDGRRNNLYQVIVSPSIDFLQNRNSIGGIAYSRYITKDSLPFYTTPLQNEISAYYLWRKPWLQPGIATDFGWGNRSGVRERKELIKRIYETQNTIARRLAANILDRIDTIVYTSKTEESIMDFSLVFSLRHSFYWLNLFSHNDYIKFTPLLSFSMGTQKFGFNRTTGVTISGTTNNIQFNRGDVTLDDKLKFQPLSLSLYLRPEYSIGKFFIQPQLIFDYYFPAAEKNFTSFFSLNAGFIF